MWEFCLERFDVAIVGAGPAGSSTAVSLARKGYSVVLFDRCLFPRHKLCGEFLNPINWPILQRLSIANDVLSGEHEKVFTFRLTSVSGAETAAAFPAHGKQHCFGLGISRFRLDNLLLRRAEKAGAVVRAGVRVCALRRCSGAWTLAIEDQGRSGELSAALLVGADGRNSWVAHRLGLAGSAEAQDLFAAVQIQLQGAGAGAVQIHLFPGGYAGIVGIGAGLANLCFAIDKRRLRGSEGIELLLESYLCRNPHLQEALKAGQIIGPAHSAYPVYFSPRRCHGERFLLVGDAARVTEPVTGEGIYFALQSGLLAADAIDLAFARGDFSAAQLSSYTQACQRAFRRRLWLNAIIRFFTRHPTLLSSIIRLSAKRSQLLQSMVQLVCAPDPAGR